MTKLYDIIAATVADLHDGPVFGLMGDANLKFLTAMKHTHGLDYYGSRHETGAVAMADAWARVTGRVGVCSVTQGPGLTNALTGLVESQKGSTPLVMLVGDTPHASRGLNQDIDQRGICEASGLRYVELSGDDSAAVVLAQEFHRAAGDSRPVVIGIPTDIQDTEIVDCQRPTQLEASTSAVAEPAAGDLAELRALIEASERPVILAGRGAVHADAGEPLAQLAQRIGALTATTVQAKGLFTGDPFCLGIAGGFSSPLAVDLFAKADLVLAFGASLTQWTMRMGTLAPDATFVRVDTAKTDFEGRFPVERAVHADAAATANALLAHFTGEDSPVPERYRTPDVIDGLRLLDDQPVAVLPPEAGPRLDGALVIRRIDELVPARKTVVVDSGHFMGYPAMHLSVDAPRRLVFAQDFQSVGLGLCGAVGAALADPTTLTVAVIGDGGLMMSLGELDTAIRVGLPLLVVVLNDAAYGAEYHLMTRAHLPVADSCFPDSDFAAVARALGAHGGTVQSEPDLRILTDWLASPDRPLLLDCKIDPSIMAPWFAEVFALKEAQAANR